jgi:hypothetical protein
MGAVVSPVLSLTPALLTQFLSPFATLTTAGGAQKTNPWNFEFNGLLVTGNSFTYIGNTPTGGFIDSISLGGAFNSASATFRSPPSSRSPAPRTP